MIFTHKNNIKYNDNAPKQGDDGFVRSMVEWLEPKQGIIRLKKEHFINIQNQLNTYLKQPWVNAERKKIASELREGIEKFAENAITFEDISGLVLNAQNRILEQDKKRLIVKKQYSRLQQTIGNMIEDINFCSKLESLLDELQMKSITEGTSKGVEYAKQMGGYKLFVERPAKNEPQLLSEAFPQRDLKNSAKLIRGCFKPFYRGFNANLANKAEEAVQEAMPVVNSMR